MMKAAILSTATALLFLLNTASYGQADGFDSSLTPDERAALERTAVLNPARGPELQVTDPEIGPTEAHAPPVNWKPAAVAPDETDEPPEASEGTSFTDLPSAVAPRMQPPGHEAPARAETYRQMNGPREQPLPPGSSRPTNYREMKGPKEQPLPGKPVPEDPRSTPNQPVLNKDL